MESEKIKNNVDLARRCLENGLTMIAKRYMSQTTHELRWNR